mmetsp:Transcript_10645/g.27358  ORF Transcript_10645/g.27358 Transcript_10645/m.27358 type:complete len:318 (-) Transcript_10645:593-1546(-)
MGCRVGLARRVFSARCPLILSSTQHAHSLPVPREPVCKESETGLWAVQRDHVATAFDGDEGDAIPVGDRAGDLRVEVPRPSIVDHVPPETSHPTLRPDKRHCSVGRPAHNHDLPLRCLLEELGEEERNILLRSFDALVVEPIVRVGRPCPGVVPVGVDRLEYIGAVEVLWGEPREARVEVDRKLAAELSHARGELGNGCPAVRLEACRRQNVVHVQWCWYVRCSLLSGGLARISGMGVVSATVGVERVPPARLGRRGVCGGRDEAVGPHERDKRKFVNIIVPVRVDARVADQKPLHIDRVFVINELLGERRAVVPTV